MAFGPNNALNRAENENQTARNTMMDLWRESLQTAQRSTQTAVRTANSQQEARTELEQRIRNGQEPCPACNARTFADRSGDGGVSFQAPRHISQAIAGVMVMAHEGEHVGANRTEADENVEAHSTVSLAYSNCQTCGRRYVSGGLTKTNFCPVSLQQNAGMDIQV